MGKQNDYQVSISEKAAQMLISQAAYLAQTNLEAAERLVVSFENAANSLSTMPQRCPWLTGGHIPQNKYRFLIFEKYYMLIFQISNNIVYADYVVDGRQNFARFIY